MIETPPVSVCDIHNGGIEKLFGAVQITYVDLQIVVDFFRMQVIFFKHQIHLIDIGPANEAFDRDIVFLILCLGRCIFNHEKKDRNYDKQFHISSPSLSVVCNTSALFFLVFNLVKNNNYIMFTLYC